MSDKIFRATDSYLGQNKCAKHDDHIECTVHCFQKDFVDFQIDATAGLFLFTINQFIIVAGFFHKRCGLFDLEMDILWNGSGLVE